MHHDGDRAGTRRGLRRRTRGDWIEFAVLSAGILDTLMPDARDELLMFFKARMLQAGYVTGIAVLAALYLIYLLAPAYIGLLIPVGLAICLLVPGLVYRHLDRQAATDG